MLTYCKINGITNKPTANNVEYKNMSI
jgi:hypothetical protein